MLNAAVRLIFSARKSTHQFLNPRIQLAVCFADNLFPVERSSRHTVSDGQKYALWTINEITARTKVDKYAQGTQQLQA